MDISDIEGAKPFAKKMRTQSVAPIPRPDKMDYRDVTHIDFKTKRETNPLDPSYKVRDEDGKVVDYGAVSGSTSNCLPPAR